MGKINYGFLSYTNGYLNRLKYVIAAPLSIALHLYICAALRLNSTFSLVQHSNANLKIFDLMIVTL